MMKRQYNPDSEKHGWLMAISPSESARRATAVIIIAVFVFGTTGIFAGCGSEDPPSERLNTEFEAEGVLDFYRPDSSLVTRIVLELAESDAEQAQGLMYRTSLPDRGGMLFIDDVPSMQSFWMRNTPLPLDILFIDSDGEIVNIVKRTTPYSDDRIESTDSAQYVLEVRAGFTDRYGISDSMYVDWKRRNFSQDEPS